MKYFFETDFSQVRGYIVFLDIDGTIAPDRIDLICQKTQKAINELKDGNEVYLLSNNKNKSRLENISRNAKLEYIKSPYHKPRIKMARGFLKRTDVDFLVIGDQIFTDVFFAKRLGAKYIRVKRLRGEGDRWFVKILYTLDDLAGRVLEIFFRL